jgi:uncharacterized membrane protein
LTNGAFFENINIRLEVINLAVPQSTTGLKKETAGALSYVLGPFTGIIFLILEKDPSVRFHAMQSIVFSVSAVVINTLLAVTVVLAPLTPLFLLGEFALWLILIYKASQGEKWEIPVLTKVVNRLLSKT